MKTTTAASPIVTGMTVANTIVRRVSMKDRTVAKPVYAVYRVRAFDNKTRQHECLGRFRSADTVVNMLDSTLVRCYAVVDGVQVFRNW